MKLDSSEPHRRSAYVHVPFCRHRCGYCNFALVAGRDDLIAQFLSALEIEMSWLGEPKPIETMFLGGGTPSHLNATQLSQLLLHITSWLRLQNQGEFTVEVNPSDVTCEKIEIFSEAGVNRLSLGAQSFDPHKLQVLERDHDARRIQAAVEMARKRFSNISLDLIFGVPGECREQWKQDLQSAISMDVQHISTYGLTFEKGTQFWNRKLHGKLDETIEEDSAWMYEYAIDELSSRGFLHYEISNFATAGFPCAHNMVYWNGGEYYGFGPGAAQHLNGIRQTNHRSTTNYLRKVLSGKSPVADSEKLDPVAKARERLIFGLRQTRGVEIQTFERENQISIESLAGELLQSLLQMRMFEKTSSGFLRLTRKGLMVSDSIWPYLV